MVWFLDLDPLKSAQFLSDRILKQAILDSRMHLSTVCRTMGGQGPWIGQWGEIEKWLAGNLSNWKWVYAYYQECRKEYKFRFDQEFEDVTLVPPRLRETEIRFDMIPQTIPRQFKYKNKTVAAYRRYHTSLGGNYTKRERPEYESRVCSTCKT